MLYLRPDYLKVIFLQKNTSYNPHTTNVITTMAVISKLGPGLWYSIHFMALRALDPNEKMGFVAYINALVEDFPCQECVQHLREYLSKHPLINYWHLELGMFQWSVGLHNDVNRRLGKPEMLYSEALITYKSGAKCNNCMDVTSDSIIIGDGSNNSSDSSDSSTTTAVPSALLDYLALRK